MLQTDKISEMMRIPSKVGRDLFYEKKRRSCASEISDISDDVGKCEKDMTLGILLELFSEYGELRYLLQEGKSLAEKAGNSTLARKELQDWVDKGGLSELRRIWGKLCVVKPAIQDEKRRRQRWKWLLVAGALIEVVRIALMVMDVA